MIDMSTEMGADATAQMTAATDEAVQRIRELTDRFIESAKSRQPEPQRLRAVVAHPGRLPERAAGASELDWVSSIAAAHAKFAQDVSAAYLSAARGMLK
jgi:hypothetical protein